MPDRKNEPATEKPSGGATRRELFHIGNMLALPALMSAWEAEAAPAPPHKQRKPSLVQSTNLKRFYSGLPKRLGATIILMCAP